MSRKSIFSEEVNTDIPVINPVEEVETSEEVIEETPSPITSKSIMTVNVDSLNVRTEPNGKVITQIIRDTEVSVDLKEGEWAKISSPVNGYCMTQYLK